MPNRNRRGRYPLRNAEATRKMLIESVGEILKEEGYLGLSVTNIARRARVDKKNIYNYFGTYNGLIKEYIMSKDFWQPVFEKFSLSQDASSEELRDFLIGVFQEQFRYFFSNEEMQKFIFWQVATPNALLKQISDEREFHGEEIAKLTDPHFAGSGISLRAVLALILGGIYYIVWHSRNNKSVVIGIDVNIEKDREEFIKTIGQVIDIVWEAAATRRKESLTDLEPKSPLRAS